MKIKHEISKKTKTIIVITTFIVLAVLIIYLIGLITQLTILWFSGTKGHSFHLSYSPFNCITYAFDFSKSMYVWIGVLVCSLFIFAYAVTMSDKRGKLDSTRHDEDKNFEYSHKETYGSARKMTDDDVKKQFKVVPANIAGLNKTDNSFVFGFLNDKKKEMVTMPDRDWKKGTDYNRNIAVCGPPGTGKTRAFVMNYILSKIRAGESLYVVDTKGEIYAKTCRYAESKGYTVKILNLIEQDCSDGWDILGDVQNDPEMATELASTVIRNTGGAKSDPFWNDAEMNMLKAVILLKSIGQADVSNVTGKKQNLGDVYKYIATRKVSMKEGNMESMEADFKFLQEYLPSHPAITPFLQFMNAGEDVCKKILHGLANRLQLFQNQQLCATLGTKDIDLIKAGTEKCIYYLRFSDQTSTYSFITALFFSFMFVKLIGYADTHGGRLPVPVNVVADEFINIGTIPDFEKKISTARSRMVNIVMIYQSNMLFESAYPDGLWEAILADCDVFLVLGVGNELTTAEFVSRMTGEATTSVSSNSIAVGTNALRSTSSTGRRYVMTPDEVRRINKTHGLVFVRDKNVFEFTKMDYTENPEYLEHKEMFDNEASVVNHKTIVEKIDVDYSNFIIDGLQRDSFMNEINTMKNNNAKANKNNNDNDNNENEKNKKPYNKDKNTNKSSSNKRATYIGSSRPFDI